MLATLLTLSGCEPQVRACRLSEFCTHDCMEAWSYCLGDANAIEDAEARRDAVLACSPERDDCLDSCEAEYGVGCRQRTR